MNTTIPIPTNKCKDIGLYCVANISPRRYYLHNSVGGTGWRIFERYDGWAIEAPDEHLLIIRLKYGV